MQISGKAVALHTEWSKDSHKSEVEILFEEGGEQIRLPAEDYIMGVIPVYLQEEDLETEKVMAVLLRTYLYYQMQEQGTKSLLAEELSLTYLSTEERKALWGSSFSEEYQRIQKAVSDTAGEVLMVGKEEERKVIYPYFHTLSAGVTRSREDASYLKEAVCDADKIADGFLSLSVWKEKEALDKLYLLGYTQAEADFSAISWEYDKEPYVKTVSLGDWSVPAEEFQKAFALKSTAFELEAYHDGIRILTRGCGMGYGVSLNMAQQFSKQGKSYKEILSTFFDAELSHYQEE